MINVYAFAADGTEEGELLTVVDILRRAGISTSIVSINQKNSFCSSHNITITTDTTIDSIDLSNADLLFFPGGMPGSKNLSDCKKLIDAIIAHIAKEKRVAAVCAAPAVVLGHHGFLKGKKATCYPGFEDQLHGAQLVNSKVITDGLFTTARGLGCCMELAFEIINLFLGEDAVRKVKEQIQY